MAELKQAQNIIYKSTVLGTQLQKLRIYKGEEYPNCVCKTLKITKQVIKQWETGKRLPTMGQMAKLANCCKMSMPYFFLQHAEPQDYEMELNTKDDQ